MDFTGKTALITGAASGMGAATAREFRAAGGQVVIVDRNEQLAAQVAGEIDAGPPVVGDVSDPAFCSAGGRNRARSAMAGWMCWSTRPASSCAPTRSTPATSSGSG